MSDLMTPEELEVFEKRLWEETSAELKKQIGYKIIHEFAARHTSQTARLIQAEATKMVRTEIDARKPELEAHLKTAVDRMFKKVDTELETQLDNVIKELAHVASGYISDRMDQQFRKISNVYYEALKEALKEKKYSETEHGG